jgi:hypothetical protein
MGQKGKRQGARPTNSFQPAMNRTGDAAEVFRTTIDQLLPFNVSPEGLQGIQFRLSY